MGLGLVYAWGHREIDSVERAWIARSRGHPEAQKSKQKQNAKFEVCVNHGFVVELTDTHENTKGEEDSTAARMRK